MTSLEDARDLMPDLDAIGDVFTMLIGQPVTLTECDPVDLSPRTAASVAELIDDDETLPIILVSDLALACRAGAALMMVDPATASEQIESGVIDEEVASNFQEVVNVMSSVFNESGGLHYRLLNQHVTPRPLPGRVVLALMRPAARMDLSVEIPDYGVGRMSFVVARPTTSATQSTDT